MLLFIHKFRFYNSYRKTPRASRGSKSSKNFLKRKDRWKQKFSRLIDCTIIKVTATKLIFYDLFSLFYSYTLQLICIPHNELTMFTTLPNLNTCPILAVQPNCISFLEGVGVHRCTIIKLSFLDRITYENILHKILKQIWISLIFFRILASYTYTIIQHDSLYFRLKW